MSSSNLGVTLLGTCSESQQEEGKALQESERLNLKRELTKKRYNFSESPWKLLVDIFCIWQNEGLKHQLN